MTPPRSRRFRAAPVKRRRSMRRSGCNAHVRAAVDYLRRCGADDIELHGGTRARITWTVGGRTMSISLTAAPGDPTPRANLARQLIRRRYAAAGIEVGA